MKPVYLEFCGVNSFSEKAEIDFKKLLSSGLFGIFGDTGSGKSTILDCIHFALYGKIERSSAAESINDKCDKAYVIFDFEISVSGKRHTYRVQRERRRKNNVAKAALYEYGEEGKLTGLAEGVGEVDGKIQEILGLGFEDFKKCIALPQGEFAGLVKAKPSERLQLVSRLFDLEKYGEKLSSSIRARSERAAAEAALAEAKLEENADGTKERVEAEKQKLALLKQEEAETEKSLKAAEEKLYALLKIAEEKTAYETLKKRVEEKSARLAYYTERKAKAEKFDAAKAVAEAEKRRAEAARMRAAAEAAGKLAAEREGAAKALAAAKKRALEESKIEEETEKYLRILGTLESAKEDIAAYREAEKRLAECTARYRVLKDKVLKEDFEKLIKENETAKEALGEDESFTEYLKRNFKDVLTAEAYGEFRTDLRKLGEKYPAASLGVAELIEKYTPKNTGKTFDMANAKLEFQRAEQRRKQLIEEREAIEKRKALFEANEREKERIAEDGKHYRERLEAAKQKLEFLKTTGSAEEIKEKIASLKAAKKRAEEELQKIEEQCAAYHTEAEKQNALKRTYEEREGASAEEVKEKLALAGFSSETEARMLAAEIGDGKIAKAECDAFFLDYEADRRKKEEFQKEKFEGFSESLLEETKTAKAELAEKRQALLKAAAVTEREIERLEEVKRKREQLELEFKAKHKERELWEKLKSLTRGGRFMEFIASEYLQEICGSASGTLLSLTGGRYFLRYDDEFKAGDNFNGGVLRSVKTLSGGETFLVSLSLALSLSGAICAKSLRPIEFFFLDEGFGTLDEKLVDTVMDVLEKLKSKSFSVGVISHVEELKHRIDNKISVTGATDTHGSTLKITAY